MSKRTKSGTLQPTFIRIRVESMDDFERIISKIERQGGRVLHAFPLQAIIAALDENQRAGLRDDREVLFVETNPVPSHIIVQEPEESRPALEAWNAFAEKKRKTGITARRGFTWDAPGFLPPDPPRHIRELLKRREKEIRNQEKSGSHH